MSGTYSNILYHLVFSTKNRRPLITNILRDKLYSYIGGIIRNEHGKCIIIGGVHDHVHITLGLKPKHRISEVVQKIKGKSSRWLNEDFNRDYRFYWQTGYGIFSVSESQKVELIRYIKNQFNHHKKITFQEEFKNLLIIHNIQFDEKDIWD